MDDSPASGSWIGFYTYAGRFSRHRMDLDLRFADGRVSRGGTDDIGPFFIRGWLEVASDEIRWVKTYPGSHDVSYRGFRDARGIWGIWNLSGCTGGFRIWPKGLSSGEALEVFEEEPIQEEALSCR